MSKKILLCCVATLLVTGLQADVLLFDDFDGPSSNNIHGTTPDITTGGATWVAHSSFKADGSFGPQDAIGMSLAFVPEDGEIYTLDTQFDNIGGGQWIQFGFSSTQSTNLWPFNLPAWGLMRQDDLRGSPYISGSVQPEWNLGSSYAAEDLDFRIVLDTTAGSSNWTATFYAKEADVEDYTNVLSATTLTDEGIISVGYSTFNSGSNFGQLNSIRLSTPPPRGTIITLY